MRWQKIRTGFFFLSALLLTLAALQSWKLAAGEDGGYSFLLKTPLSAEEAASLSEQNRKDLEKAAGEGQEESPAEFVLWGQEKEQVLTEPDYGRRTDADVVYLSGPSNLLFPGSALTQETKNGCLIDEKTSDELFGTKNPAGRTLTFGGRTYQVCGILREISPTLAILVTRQWITESTVQTKDAGGPEITLDHVFVPKTKGGTAEKARQSLQNVYGLEGELMDTQLLFGLTGALLLLTPLCLFVTYVRWNLREIRSLLADTEKGRKRLLLAAELLLLAAALWAAARFFLGTVEIPADYLPTKWSDFDFWSSLFEEKAQAIRNLLSGERGPMEWGTLEKLGEAAAFGAGAFLCYLLGRNPEKSN